MHRNGTTRIPLTAIILLSIAGTAFSSEINPRDLRDFLATSVANQRVAGGSLLVIHRGQTVLHIGFGYSDIKKNTPFPNNAPVVVASISKPLLGTAIFHLAEAGKLDSDSPITRYLPEFENLMLESGEPAPQPPTLQQLLTHTSGMRNDTAERGRPWLASWVRGQSLEAVVKRYAAEFPYEAQPGTRYAYSGIGYDTAARIAEVAASLPRDQLLRRELAVPLGMTHTCFRSDPARPRDLPKAYHINDDGELRLRTPRHTPAPGTYTSSGGSMISTATDLANWLLMFRNHGRHDGKVYLKHETIRRMLSPAPRGKQSLCGFFIRKRRPDGSPAVIGHTGSSGTNCWIDLERDIIGIMLTQTKGSDITRFRVDLEKKVTAAMDRGTPVPPK